MRHQTYSGREKGLGERIENLVGLATSHGSFHKLETSHFITVLMAPISIGVLALQGAFQEHLDHLEEAAALLPSHEFRIFDVRTTEALSKCDALVIPGGESTAISLVAERTGMLEPLRQFVQDPAKAVWGTCAGLIFLGSRLKNGRPEQKQLHGLDIEVTRNVFGSQVHSFTVDLDFSSFIPGLTQFPTTFIRAPVVSDVGKDVEVLCKLEDSGLIVAVRQDRRLGTSFHPELASSCAFHKWFITDFVLKDASS